MTYPLWVVLSTSAVRFVMIVSLYETSDNFPKTSLPFIFTKVFSSSASTFCSYKSLISTVCVSITGVSETVSYVTSFSVYVPSSLISSSSKACVSSFFRDVYSTVSVIWCSFAALLSSVAADEQPINKEAAIIPERRIDNIFFIFWLLSV